MLFQGFHLWQLGLVSPSFPVSQFTFIASFFLPPQIIGHKLPYDSLHEIRHRLEEVSPNLTRYGEVEEANYFKQATDLSQVGTTCLTSSET